MPYFSDANVTWLRQSTGEIIARIIAEKDNPMADVLWGTPVEPFARLIDMGLLEPYVSPETKYYDDRFRDPNGYWSAATLWVAHIAYNTKVFEEQKLGDPPQTWKDLLDPKWKGKILVPNPNTSGTGYTFYVGMISLLGEDGAINYLKKLDENVIEWTKSGGATCRRLGAGENAVSVTGTYISWLYIKEGYPIKNIFPPEGLPWTVEATGLIKGAKNPNMAKAFIDWALGKHANELAREFRKEDCSARKDLAPLPGLPRDVEQNLVKIDFYWTGKNQERLLDALNRAIPRLRA
jgi:iron(III) transport system substrate-binding protein